MTKVVFITGVTSGFGFEISKLLSSQGNKVYGTTRQEGRKIPDGVQPIIMELTNHETIQNAVQKVISTEGKIDVLINNAGMHSGGPVEEIDEELYRKHFETNLFGWLMLIQEVLPHMRKNGGGIIVNISSIGGLTGLPFQGVHSATKFAIEGLSQALRTEVRDFNIKVIVINPGDAHTQNTFSRIIRIKRDSPYKAQFERTLAIIEHDEQNGMAPEVLAYKISRIIKTRKPLNRYVVASFYQRLACIVKRLIPERHFFRLIAHYYKFK